MTLLFLKIKNMITKKESIKLTKQMKSDWIDALKSGKYVQTIGQLQDENGFCCIGVFCEIQNIKHNKVVCLETDKPSKFVYGPVENIIGAENVKNLVKANDEIFDIQKPDFSNVIPLIEKLETID